MEESKNETMNQAHTLFDQFVQATTCKGTLKAFQELCDHLELKPKDYRSFYHKLKSKLNYWKAKALWAKLDKRGSHKDYKKGKACTNTKCLIIGAGPCGLRTAIDLSLLGAKVVVIEKRDAFSRNNVLHLWPFTIHDLRGLGAKKFYGKFCAGAIDHISIRQLQLILLKVALILGIEIHVSVEFQGLVHPPEDQENERIGWRALVHPKTHPVSEYEFEVIIGGDGRRNTLEGFRRKEFRGKLAIAITANFINRNTTAEAKVEEISGVAFIFNQKFFQELREATGIDLENIVYYKDDTHYFVMTAKKQSLLDKGVILHDYADTELLLSRENVDQEALLNYAREAADFSTQQQLPSLDFAINHYGQPDVAMFDFTCMYASENAALVREQNGHQLLVALVGDSLLEPFWPMGTGIARGFLAAMDSAWMVRSWSLGTSPLEVLAERESIYRLLPQTTPENVSKNFSQYSIDPVTRYPNININFLRPTQVRHLYDTGETKDIHLEMENLVNSRTTPKLTRNESVPRSSKLLGWCQRQTDGYTGVNVTDLTMSWKSGLALCAIIHRYRPDLIDFDSLDEQNVEKNNQLAFDIAEKELGISPIMTGKEMASVGEPDKLSMVMYLTQFYEMFKDSLPSSGLGRGPPSPSDRLPPRPSLTPLTQAPGLGKGTIISPQYPAPPPHPGLTPLAEASAQAAGTHSCSGPTVVGSALGPGKGPLAPGTASFNRVQLPSLAPPLLPAITGQGGKDALDLNAEEKAVLIASTKSPISFLSKLGQTISRKRSPKDKKEKDLDGAGKRRKTSQSEEEEVPRVCRGRSTLVSTLPDRRTDVTLSNQNKVKYMATQLLAKFEENAPPQSTGIRRQKYIKMYTGGVSSLAEQIANQLQRKEQPKTLLDKKDLGSVKKEFPQNLGGSDTCYFCQKRVYVMERLSAEGKFFHRSCFKCEYCATTLRLSAYAYDIEDGAGAQDHGAGSLSLYQATGTAIGAQDHRASGLFLSRAASAGTATGAQTLNTGASPYWSVRFHSRSATQLTDPSQQPTSLVAATHSFSSPAGPISRKWAKHQWTSTAPQDPNSKFYCKPHYCYRLSSSAQRKRPAVTLLSGKEARGPVQDGPIADASAPAGTITNPADRTPGSSVNGLEEPSIAKRLRGTPERIELENYRLSVKQAEELQEVPEETQAEHNLSSVLDKGLEEDVASSSSESEMEEEEEPPLPTSDLGGVPWKEALNNDNEEEDYDEEEGEEDYEEEEEESSEVAGSQRLQQIINATDPLEIQADVHWTHVHEKEEEERTVPTSEPSTSRVPFDEDGLEEDVDSEPAEIEGEAAENGDTGDTGAELDDDQHWSDDSPSDAETEFCKQHQEVVEAELELNVSENQDERPPATLQHNKRAPSQVSSPTWSPSEQAVLFSPAHSPMGEEARIPLPSETIKVKLPKERLFPELLVSKGKFKAEVPTDQKAVHSPIQSQPGALLEARTHTSPVSSQGLSPLATSTITPTQHPICSQPKPSCEAAIPSPTKSPICFQPVPAKTSTPLTPLHVKNQGDAKDRLGSPLAMDEALKPNDLVTEFWMKSAEIRRSLGLTPVDRSKGPKHSFPSPAFKPLSLKSYSVEKSPQDEGLHLLKPPSKRLAKSDSDQPSLPTPKSPSDRELKSSHEERRDLSSSSGLGLHGSSSNMKTLGSQSFNTSDSTMLTPPSSPPPPPPQDEEPATLQREPYQIYGQKETKPKASIIPPPTPATFMRPPREPAQWPWEEVRKSFVESVAEIPFADDVEDTYDDKTEDSNLQKFFTPPSCWPLSDKALPPPLVKENVSLLTLESGVQLQKRGLPVVSPEAKELAEERMRAREKSIKSQVLRDAMAKQLSRMKEMEIGAETSSPLGGTCHKASSMPSKGKALGLESPKHPVHKGPEEPTLKHKNTSEEFLSPTLDSGAPDGSVTSSEGSSGKSKKRSSLFSPRRNKERKSKGEGRPLEKHSPDLLEEVAAKPRSLWKSVFSGYKKDKKKKGDNKSCSSTPSSGATVASSKHRMSPIVKAELQLRDQLSFSEDSDLSSDDILERVSQKSKREPRTYTEEELNAKLTRRVQKAARRQAKQEELKRLHRAQIIQRQLEQVEERQRQLEERGVAVEKALRGEAGMGKKDDPKLMQEWFRLVQEKNAMVRYESELMIFARELELEDRQSRLQQELRERMAMEDHLKTEEELSEEKKILNEMLEVVEQRDALVALLEEQRLREKEEDKDLEAVMLSKGFSLNWS
ncbi:Protein MICAL-3 [Myotis davidii]|uniref:F-actin monooxygenase n=1 Tax=Myotis davidii TaxID=225400 RepID=L5MJX3_MYODS|nr:Protein MICAL-3 [Myotis davidii]